MEPISVLADYFQIHLLDEHSEVDLSEYWTERVMFDGVAAAPDAMIIKTEVNVSVAVYIDVITTDPADDITDFDYVSEASIKTPSGKLVVMGASDYLPDADRFEVVPGWIRVRVLRWNLSNAAHAGIESDERVETTEQLRIQVWPAPFDEVRVLKRWTPVEDV